MHMPSAQYRPLKRVCSIYRKAFGGQGVLRCPNTTLEERVDRGIGRGAHLAELLLIAGVMAIRVGHIRYSSQYLPLLETLHNISTVPSRKLATCKFPEPSTSDRAWPKRHWVSEATHRKVPRVPTEQRLQRVAHCGTTLPCVTLQTLAPPRRTLATGGALLPSQ